VTGLFLFALAIVLILESRLGLAPWDVLNQGVSRHTPLSFGTANIAVGVTVLLVAWALGAPPGLGTLANAVLVGAFIDGLLAVPAISDLGDASLGARIALLVVGILLTGPASTLYIGADFGAGPRDTLMLVSARRTGARIGLVRTVLEVTAFAAGAVLGGTFGVGTILFALLVGPIIDGSFELFARSPFARAEASATPVVVGE
jgi:uncharacterized membrane protein YczE